jgi:hypothetical protein
METRCSEGSPHGDKVTLSFYIPEQDAIDAGELPDFSINVLDLLVQEESKGVEGTAGLFVVDAWPVTPRAQTLWRSGLWLPKRNSIILTLT